MQSDCDKISHWKRVQDSQNRIFYINYVQKETSWHLPVDLALPEEWQEMTDDNGYTFFADHKNQITTWVDPRLPSVGNTTPLMKRTIDIDAPKVLEIQTPQKAHENDLHHSNPWKEKREDDTFDTWSDLTLKNKSCEGTTQRFIAPFFEREEPLLCRQCNSKFGVLRRRHHCRLCGYIHCSDCLPVKVRLPIPNATITTTTESSLSRLQNVCVRCARNVTTGEYCSIVGLRYCLFQANQDATSFTLEERVELIKQLAETFRSPRKESSSGMGPHRIAQLNDIEAAGGAIAFCELLVPLIDEWIATPNVELEVVICKTIEMLVALVKLVIQDSDENSSPDAFCNSGTCRGILNVLQVSHRASGQKALEHCTLKLMHRLLSWEACRQLFSEADCVHHLAQILASTSDTANGHHREIRVLAVQCLREFLTSNMETTRQILILQGLKSLWSLMIQILGASESSEKYVDSWSGVESTESISIILEAMSACLQYVCDDSTLANSYLRDKLTLDDLSLSGAKFVVEDTSQKKWVFAQIPDCAIDCLVSIIAHGNPLLCRSSTRVCRMISNVPALLRHIAKETSSPSLEVLLNMLGSFSMQETNSIVENVAACCTASNILANLCCSMYAPPSMQGHEGRDAWMMFMHSMDRHGGLDVVLRVINDLPQAKHANAAIPDAELLCLEQNLIEIIHGFALTSDSSYLCKLCGDNELDTENKNGCLHPLGAFLMSNRLSGVCADMILILLRKAPNPVSAWRNLCPDGDAEHALLLFFKSWLVMQDDRARQRTAVQFYLLYFRAPAKCRLAGDTFPNSVLDVIFHLTVTLATRDIRVECLELLLESLTHLPKKHARMHDQLTEQACFVSLMQILCARRYTNIIDKRIRRYASSSYLLSLPTVTFANLDAENHSQWIVLKCLRTVLPDDEILNAEETSVLETDSKLRARAERIVRRMMDISVLQAFCTALWNVLVRLSQDNPSESEVESIRKWCEAIFDVLERILTLLTPASIAKRERHIIDLVRVIIYILVSQLMEENTRGSQQLATSIFRVIRILFRNADWRLRFATLLRKEVTCDMEEDTLFVQNTVVFIRLLLRQLSDPEWTDDCVLMLKQLLLEPLFHHQYPKNHAFLEQVLSRTNIGETLITLVCETETKGNEESQRFHLILETLKLSLHCESICEAAVADLDTLGYFLQLYMDANSPESLQEIAGVLLAGFSQHPDAFRKCLKQNVTDTLALKILRNLILARPKTAGIPRQQQIAEEIVRNLAASDSLTCPLWVKCLGNTDVTLLIAIIEHASHIKVQEVAARKLVEIILQAFKDTQEHLMAIMEQLYISSEWISRILDLFFAFESDRAMSATGLRTIVSLVSLMGQASTCDQIHEIEGTLIQYQQMERLAVEGAHALLFWLREEQTQHDVVTVLFDGIHAETRVLFYKQIIPNGSTNATADVLLLINALTTQLDELHCEFWPHRNSGFSPNVVFSQFVAPICKCCVLLCECLQCMDEQNWVLSSADGLEGLVRVSSLLLEWVAVTDDLDENNAHALIVTILELLECETCSLDLCRKLVQIDTIKVALQFLQRPDFKHELILQTLSLLKMLLIVDMNQFIECQGIELLLQMLFKAIQEHYDGGSRIAHKVMELFNFMYKHSRLCNRGDTLLWRNEQIVNVVDNSVIELTDRLESVKIAFDEGHEHAEIIGNEAPWISVLGYLVLFVFKSWSKDMTPVFTASSITKSRIYDFFKWITRVSRHASYREKLQWEDDDYREFMCTAIPVLELGLIRCDNWTVFEDIGDVLLGGFNTIASHAETTMDRANFHQLLSTICAALISYFTRPNTTHCRHFHKNGRHAFSVLKSIHRNIEWTTRSAESIITMFDLIETILPHLAIHWNEDVALSLSNLEDSQPYRWILCWILDTLDVVLSDASQRELFTATLKLLRSCCFVESLQKLLLSPTYLPRVTLQLEKAMSFNEKIALKILQILGKPAWEFSISQFREKETSTPLLQTDVCILVRCYHCQQTVTLSPLDILNWKSDKVSKCTYCHLPIARAIQSDGGALSLSADNKNDTIKEHVMVEEYSVLQSSFRNSISNVGALKSNALLYNSISSESAVISEDGENWVSDHSDTINANVTVSESIELDTQRVESTDAIIADQDMIMTRCRHCKTMLCAPKQNTYKCMKCFQTTWR